MYVYIIHFIIFFLSVVSINAFHGGNDEYETHLYVIV